MNCRCDNMAVVSEGNSGYCRDTTLMHMLRCLFFMASHFNVTVQASHIPGVANIAADALSRNQFSRFLQVVPDAAQLPSPIPQREWGVAHAQFKTCHVQCQSG